LAKAALDEPLDEVTGLEVRRGGEKFVGC